MRFVLIHAGPQFGQTHWATPEAEVTAALLAVGAPWLGSVPMQTQLHRWRYSLLHDGPALRRQVKRLATTQNEYLPFNSRGLP